MSDGRVITGAALITNPTGLHARPAVKLTKLAKSFEAQLRLRVGQNGKWTDAKSVARVLSLKAPAGQTLFFEAEGPDARQALSTITELVRRNFDEGSQQERQFEGQVASAGLGDGFLVVCSRPQMDGFNGAEAANPQAERKLLEGALARAALQLERLKSSDGGAIASEILDFQLELLRDSTLLEPAYRSIGEGRPAARAFGEALEAQIAEYRSATDKYFAARASDLTDLRDRVLAALAPVAHAPEQDAPAEGGIYLADDLTPSRFLELDWSRWRGVALLGGSAASHVAILARSRGVPLLVGVRAALEDVVDGEAAVLDAETGRLIVSPSEATTRWVRERQQARLQRAELDEKYRAAPAVSGGGTRVAVQINVESEKTLEDLAPASCDGIGLTRTEFLFHGKGTLPDEETQYRFYSRLIGWAAGRPVTIRTLDAGGDKPIPGLTPLGESNPFLGVRGVRLSLAHPDVFRVQLRALARAAVLGPLKVMLPMVTTPAELDQVREMLREEAAALDGRGVPTAVPPLGIMVEVPAVAIAISRFDAAFYSIGTNDLIQYVTACSRDCANLSALYDPLNPAVLELISRVAAHGRACGREVSVCGEMASDPNLVPHLLDAGITSLSVAPAALGRVKHAVSDHAR
jgi:phosphoenolpyruvate-protein phosphotransferase (PTS system enzyme I)